MALSLPSFERADAIFEAALGADADSATVGGTEIVRYSWAGLFVEVRLGEPVGLQAVYINTARGADEPHRAVAGIPFLPEPDLPGTAPR